MRKVKQFSINTAEKTIGSVIINEKELLNELGYEIDEDETEDTTLDVENIKYEKLSLVKLKNCDLQIFSRYTLFNTHIIPALIIRVRMGAEYIDVTLHDESQVKSVINALKRFLNRLNKINKSKTCPTKNNLVQIFSKLPGVTLKYLTETESVPISKSEKEAQNKNKIEKYDEIK